MTLKAFQFVNVMLLSLVMGSFWGTWFGLSRSISTITPATFLEVAKVFLQNFGSTMPVLLPLAILSTIPVIALLFRRRMTSAFKFTLIGFLLFVIALSGTLLVNVPIDNQIATWTLSTLPPDWQEIRDRWGFYHAARTLLTVVGLGLIVVGALHSEKSRVRSPRSPL